MLEIALLSFRSSKFSGREGMLLDTPGASNFTMLANDPPPLPQPHETSFITGPFKSMITLFFYKNVVFPAQAEYSYFLACVAGGILSRVGGQREAMAAEPPIHAAKPREASGEATA